jgi:hypothetical protein
MKRGGGSQRKCAALRMSINNLKIKIFQQNVLTVQALCLLTDTVQAR